MKLDLDGRPGLPAIAHGPVSGCDGYGFAKQDGKPFFACSENRS
jgi:hypothetical protein